MNWRARLYNDISSWSETERRNEMLLKAAFINGLRCNIYNNKEYEDRYSG